MPSVFNLSHYFYSFFCGDSSDSDPTNLLVLFGLSACATSLNDNNDGVDANIEPQIPVENTDPMRENNERIIKEGREDVWRKGMK